MSGKDATEDKESPPCIGLIIVINPSEGDRTFLSHLGDRGEVLHFSSASKDQKNMIGERFSRFKSLMTDESVVSFAVVCFIPNQEEIPGLAYCPAHVENEKHHVRVKLNADMTGIVAHMVLFCAEAGKSPFGLLMRDFGLEHLEKQV